MFIATTVMGVLAAFVVYLSYQKGVHVPVLKSSWVMLLEMLPILIFAFIIGSSIQKLVPSEIIVKWVGAESGLKGVMIGTIGAFTPGGPYVTMPIAAGLMRAGVGVGPLVSFMTAWSLIGFGRLPMEIGIMGWRFAMIRLACTFFFAPIAGLLANLLFSRIRLF